MINSTREKDKHHKIEIAVFSTVHGENHDFQAKINSKIESFENLYKGKGTLLLAMATLISVVLIAVNCTRKKELLFR